MLYVKTIGERQVFSSCKSIQTNDGIWISNPSQEQILAAGWEIYIPPVVPPVPQTNPEVNEIMNAVKKMLSNEVENLSDEDALSVAALFPTWISKLGQEVSIGERVWYNEKLYKVILAHTVQDNWTPDVSVSLFVEVTIEEWPEWVQPISAADAYSLNDRVSHNNKHWESTYDNNVWEPGVFGWQEL